MKLNQILYIVIGFLVFVLISGTIAGIFNSNTNKDELTALQKLLNQGQAVNLNAPAT